jgi:hypothetical protein
MMLSRLRLRRLMFWRTWSRLWIMVVEVLAVENQYKLAASCFLVPLIIVHRTAQSSHRSENGYISCSTKAKETEPSPVNPDRRSKGPRAMHDTRNEIPGHTTQDEWKYPPAQFPSPTPLSAAQNMSAGPQNRQRRHLSPRTRNVTCQTRCAGDDVRPYL